MTRTPHDIECLCAACERRVRRMFARDPRPVEFYAMELLRDESGNHRAAFIAAIDTRGTDRRTMQFKHYDKIVNWMSANWAPELS